MVVAQGFSPDLGVQSFHGLQNTNGIRVDGHLCWQWRNADLREYVDFSDFQAMIAPRPLVVGTGTNDTTFSMDHTNPFKADKQVVRRARKAYAGIEDEIIHYLFTNHFQVNAAGVFHHYHVGGFRRGDCNPVRFWRTAITEIQLPIQAPNALAWQTDSSTLLVEAANPNNTLFDHIQSLFPFRLSVCEPAIDGFTAPAELSSPPSRSYERFGSTPLSQSDQMYDSFSPSVPPIYQPKKRKVEITFEAGPPPHIHRPPTFSWIARPSWMSPVTDGGSTFGSSYPSSAVVVSGPCGCGKQK
jgi:hypothetical protein